MMPKLGDLVFVLNTRSDEALAKFINQRAAALYSSRRPKNFENENFLCLETAEIDMEGQVWVKKNDSGHKNSSF